MESQDTTLIELDGDAEENFDQVSVLLPAQPLNAGNKQSSVSNTNHRPEIGCVYLHYRKIQCHHKPFLLKIMTYRFSLQSLVAIMLLEFSQHWFHKLAYFEVNSRIFLFFLKNNCRKCAKIFSLYLTEYV